MVKVIVITGTPGTGKSTLAKKLAKKTEFRRLDLHDYYKKISTSYDRSGKCYIIDLKKLELLVGEKKRERYREERRERKVKKGKEIGEKGIIIDSHLAHLLPKKLVDLCIVVVCPDLKKLQKRLEKRGYGKRKIRENLDAEIFQVCLVESKEKGHKVIVVDTDQKKDVDVLLKRLKPF